MRSKSAGVCVLVLIAVFAFLSGCSINKIAMNAVANVLGGDGGSSSFTADSDPQLVGDALPFALKMYEKGKGAFKQAAGAGAEPIRVQTSMRRPVQVAGSRSHAGDSLQRFLDIVGPAEPI